MWDKTFNAMSANWHMNANKKRSNANGFYSPGVDRFFGVDSLDPYTAFEVAQILSSKVSGIAVCVLQNTDPFFTADDCHKYTITNKSVYQGQNILVSRQMPAFRKMQGDAIVREDTMPADWQQPEAWDQFLKLKDYTKFVIQAWHSAKLADMHFNYMPMEAYTDTMLFDTAPANFDRPVDNIKGPCTQGITRTIKQILYTSNGIEEALTEIEQLWAENNTPQSGPWRSLFYRILEIDEPERLQELPVNADQFSGFLI